jgi:DDE family transposase
LAWCDNTGELLAVICRPGNAGSNTAADHIAIIDAAIAAIPAKGRRNLLITIDGAGSSHAVVEHLRKLNARPGWSVAYSVGFDLDERGPGRDRADARRRVGGGAGPGRQGPRRRAGGRADRAAARGRRRRPARRLAGRHAHPGAAGEDRARDAIVTVRADQRLPLPGHRDRHPGRTGAAARGPPPGARPGGGFIRCGKDTGLARWPSHSFAINTAWVTAVALAIDLLCWMRLLLLDGPLAKAEPATLRYRLLPAAARLVKRSRYLILRVPETWPWAREFAAAVNRVRAIP